MEFKRGLKSYRDPQCVYKISNRSMLYCNINHHHQRCYSLLQALTAPTMRLHSLLSSAFLLHPYTPTVFRSCSTLSIHLIGGLPTFLFPSILVRVTLRHGSSSFSLKRWPSHLTLELLITFTTSVSPYIVYNSSLYLLRHTPFLQIGPKILLRIFLSNILSLFSCNLVSVQLSLP